MPPAWARDVHVAESTRIAVGDWSGRHAWLVHDARARRIVPPGGRAM